MKTDLRNIHPGKTRLCCLSATLLPNRLSFFCVALLLLQTVGVQTVGGQTLTGFSLRDLSLRGKVRTMEYAKYYGYLRDGAFVKEKKASYNTDRSDIPVVQVVFDTEGRTVSQKDYNEKDELCRQITCRYNERGRLLSREELTSYRGNYTLRFRYDRNNRLVEHRSLDYPWGGNEATNRNPSEHYLTLSRMNSGAAYRYDAEGRLTEVTGIGDGYGEDVFGYDESGYLSETNNLRAQWLTQTISTNYHAQWLNKTFTYDSQGRLTEVISYHSYHLNPVVRVVCTYAEEGYLREKTIYNTDRNTQNPPPYVYQCEYNAQEQILTEHMYGQYGKNEKYTFIYTYNEQGDMASRTGQRVSTGEKIVSVSYTYEYDEQGNWTRRYEYEGDKRECRYLQERTFQYD